MQGRAQALLLTQHKPPRPHVKCKKQSPKFPASLRSRSQDSSRTCPETEERGPEWEQSCFFSPSPIKTSRCSSWSWQGRGITLGGHLLDAGGAGLCSAVPRERSPAATAPVCTSSCVGPSLPIKIQPELCLVWNKQAVAAEDFTTSRFWLASKAPKQNKIQLASLQIEASFSFLQQLLNKRFDTCAAAPVPAFSPESCAGRMEKMFKVMGVL